MAIKRPSKSRGTPVRKPVSTTTIRHVEVVPVQRMVAGEAYVGWLCKNRSCGLLIAVAPPPPGEKLPAAAPEDQISALKCPHCGNEDLYRWSARSELRYTPKSGGE